VSPLLIVLVTVYGYWVTLEIVSQMWMTSLADPTSQGAMNLIRHLQTVVSHPYFRTQLSTPRSLGKNE
jgi:hypothetical protein